MGLRSGHHLQKNEKDLEEVEIKRPQETLYRQIVEKVQNCKT